MISPLPWMRFLFNLLCLACILLPLVAYAAVEQPRSYVEDQAGIISPDARSNLAGLLQELEQKTGVQFIILTVPSTEGIPIEQFSLERAESWGLGRKGKDNGLLMVIAVQDRKYRFETGYGLEQILPDSLLGTIGRKYVVPRFKQGDYSRGISDAASVIVRTIADAEGVKLSGLPEVKEPGRPRGLPFGPFLFLLLVFLFIASRSGRSGGLAQAILIGSMLGGRGYRSSGGFGSFGGGGFGSFGGGGGGGFGGGGASGGW